MSESNTWSAIVIGSGLGGLAAGAAAALRGKRVLVLERLANFGGAATIYRHGSLTMEASLHETDGETVGSAHGVFARLGLRGAVEPIATDSFYEARGGPLSTPARIPHGLDAANASMQTAFPHAAQAIKRYFREVKTLHHAFRDLEEIGARGTSAVLGLIFSGGLFTLIGDAHRTMSKAFEALLGDHEDVKCALGAPLSYFDDDPASMSFLLYAGVWSRYVESGAWYFRGGSRALTLALLSTMRAAGGSARHRCVVKEILLDAAGHAAGVRFEDESGQSHEARAPIIFANVAPSHVHAMLPVTAQANFLQPYTEFEASVSLFNVSLGLSRPASDFGVTAYSTFVFPREFRRFDAFPKAAAVFGRAPGGEVPPYVIADYGRLDTGLRGDGDPYLVSLCGIDRLSWWADLNETEEMARRSEWLRALIQDVERHFPGLAAAVTQSEIATARTMKNRLGTPNGEVYGFRPTPTRLFHRPPSAATSVPGLWLSSAYTVAGGYAGAMQGGLMAADAAFR